MESGRAVRCPEFGSGVAQRLEVVADFRDIGSGRRPVPRLEGEQIHQRGLRTFDLGGDHCFLADEGVEEPVEGGDHLASEVEPGQRVLRGAKALPEAAIQDEGRRLWWEGKGHERQDFLVSGQGAFIPARGARHSSASRVLGDGSHAGFAKKGTASSPSCQEKNEVFINITQKSSDRS